MRRLVKPPTGDQGLAQSIANAEPSLRLLTEALGCGVLITYFAPKAAVPGARMSLKWYLVGEPGAPPRCVVADSLAEAVAHVSRFTAMVRTIGLAAADRWHAEQARKPIRSV